MSVSSQAPTVQERANAVPKNVFLGGPRGDFEAIGRLVFVTLFEQGLQPHHRVLDVGCGCLRAGYWLIHFLEPRRYFGIEPDERMLAAGLAHIVEPDVVERNEPAFSNNADFDFSVFDTPFDVVVARSIWTHASKGHIEKMLDGFAATAAPGGRMLASYIPARPIGFASGRMGALGFIARDYKGDEWIGHSHERKRGGLVAHRRRWIREQCARRGLRVVQLRGNVANHQRWLRITSA